MAAGEGPPCSKATVFWKQGALQPANAAEAHTTEGASSSSALRCLGVAGAAAAAFNGEAADVAVVCVEASLGGCSARSRSPSTAFLSFTCRLRFSSCAAAIRHYMYHESQQTSCSSLFMWRKMLLHGNS